MPCKNNRQEEEFKKEGVLIINSKYDAPSTLREDIRNQEKWAPNTKSGPQATTVYP